MVSAARVEDLARALSVGQEKLGGCRLVTIDGPAGAGKSTLAGALAGALAGTASMPAAMIVPMDDLYDGWAGLNEELFARLERSILLPLSRGRPAQYRRYDWSASDFGESTTVDPPVTLILEGVGAGDPVTRRWANLSVWLDVPGDVGAERARLRDPGITSADWDVWLDLQGRYFAQVDNRASADVKLKR